MKCCEYSTRWFNKYYFRYFEYAAIKSELYMLDFCYFVNFNVAIQTAFYPDNLAWYLFLTSSTVNNFSNNVFVRSQTYLTILFADLSTRKFVTWRFKKKLCTESPLT